MFGAKLNVFLNLFLKNFEFLFDFRGAKFFLGLYADSRTNQNLNGVKKKIFLSKSLSKFTSKNGPP
jgi:hypothetical protein